MLFYFIKKFKKIGKGFFFKFINIKKLKFKTFTGKINHFDQENVVRRV